MSSLTSQSNTSDWRVPFSFSTSHSSRSPFQTTERHGNIEWYSELGPSSKEGPNPSRVITMSSIVLRW